MGLRRRIDNEDEVVAGIIVKVISTGDIKDKRLGRGEGKCQKMNAFIPCTF
jgi:hypothetical protein